MKKNKIKFKKTFYKHFDAILLIAIIITFCLNNKIASMINSIMPFTIMPLPKIIENRQTLSPDQALEQIVITFVFPVIILLVVQIIILVLVGCAKERKSHE
ncbi:ABC-type transport system involved in multi-copper enzyme maturation permease subunit [Lachnospiraceae bacterium PF1-22]